MHFDALAKHSPVNSKTYAAVLHVLIKEFEKRFQDCWKKSSIFGVFVTPFSVDINTLPANFQMEGRVAMTYSTQKLDHLFTRLL